jgi:hypothetical protein
MPQVLNGSRCPRFAGMTDYYRDRVRHGGILANNFVKFWWENQVGPMQYGTEEKRPRRFGPGVMGPPVGELQRLQ